ncbi:hypothetical protein [Streptomyces sp. NPDC002676]
MASKASSEAFAAGAPAQVPKLPGLGRTWYARGAAYWLRRVVTSGLWLLLLAFISYLVVRLYASFRVELSPTLRLVWDCVQAAASCAAVVWGWVVARRRHAKALLDPPTPDEARAARRARTRRNLGLVAAGRIVWLIVMPVMPSVFAYAIGEFVAALTVRESAAEAGARRWLEERRSGT